MNRAAGNGQDSDPRRILERGLRLHQDGRLGEAADLYERVLSIDGRNFDALHMSGLVAYQAGDLDKALERMGQAAQIDARSAPLFNNLALVLKDAGQPERAGECLQAALVLHPDYPEALNNLGTLYEAQGEPQQARQCYVRALALQPDYGQARRNLGLARVRAGEEEQAIADLTLACAALPLDGEIRSVLADLLEDRDAEATLLWRAEALGLCPEDETLRLRLAGALLDVGRLPDAEGHYRHILSTQPAHAVALTNLALALQRQGRSTEALEVLRRATHAAPGLAAAWTNLGSMLLDAGEMSEAGAALEKALQLAPELADAHNNLGMVLKAQGELEQARQCYEQALRLRSDFIQARFNLGNVCKELGDNEQAWASFRAVLQQAPAHAQAHYSLGLSAPDPAMAAAHLRAALEAQPDYPEALVALVYARLRVCDWDGIDAQLTAVRTLVRERPQAPVSPFWFLAMSDFREEQQRCARQWVLNRLLPEAARWRRSLDGRRHERDGARLRIGYLSGDFRSHAVGEFLPDLLAAHRSERFEVHAYSSGPDDGGVTRARIASSCEHFHDVRAAGLGVLAQQIEADGIDILVDLSGHTEHSRSAVLLLDAAPVQVSYLGFPGTLGSKAVHYLIGDAVLTPAAHASSYDECLAQLPGCYQPGRRFVLPLAGQTPTRAQCGLPEDALVLCCFNNGYKIRPQIFEVWMRILSQVPQAVLWLAQFNPGMTANLQREAQARGVDAQRLIFAPLVAIDAHSTRLALADLFLDTTPYAAGATAAQTLWAGVPLLSIVGETYVGRMSASVLAALDLDELVVANLDEYERTALSLTRDVDRLRELRARLQRARESSTVFDGAASAHALERLYEQMWQRHAVGAAPAPILT